MPALNGKTTSEVMRLLRRIDRDVYAVRDMTFPDRAGLYRHGGYLGRIPCDEMPEWTLWAEDGQEIVKAGWRHVIALLQYRRVATWREIRRALRGEGISWDYGPGGPRRPRARRAA